MVCSTCNNIVPYSYRFCGHCGSAITQDALEEAGVYQADKTRVGRRYVTSLFTDIVDSTRLAKMFDPEELQRILQVYQKQSAQVISDFGGHIIEIHGDGLMAIFYGRENATESAVRAGYDLVQSILKLRAVGPLHNQTKLHNRVGIASGEALINAPLNAPVNGHSSLEVVGTPNYLASRLQEFAQQDEVVVCPETYKRTSGFFKFSQIPNSALKGFSEVEHIWKVEQPYDAAIRFNHRHQVLTPLIGREDIIDTLLNRWDQTLGDKGQVVFLRGGAGVGKSRVLSEFVQRVNRRTATHMKLTYQCSEFAKDVPLYPVIKQISRATDINKNDSSDEIEAKLESVLHSWHVDPKPYKDVLMPLVHNAHSSRGLAGELDKAQISAAIKACMKLPLYFTERAPVLVIVEDIQFADQASRRLLNYSIKYARHVRMMIVVTSRPEYEAPYTLKSYVTQICVKRLTKRQSRELLSNVKFKQVLPPEVCEDILDKSDGVPLHIEELALHISQQLEKSAGNGQHKGLRTPATLFDSFIERFDRYPEHVQEVARAAAVIGREFDQRMLCQLLNESEDAVADALDTLVNNEEIYQIGEEPDQFSFKHALLREAIYDNTLNQIKFKLHKSVVEHLQSSASQSTLTTKQIRYHDRMQNKYLEYGET